VGDVVYNNVVCACPLTIEDWMLNLSCGLVDDNYSLSPPAIAANTSPIRTVTTTRTEIVPGTYGKLKVYTSGDFGIDVCAKSELSDVIANLTLIRDALD